MGRWVLVVALLTALVTACRTAPPAEITRVPDPLVPPVAGSELNEKQANAARAAVTAAERGDLARAERELASLPLGHPVTRLVAVEVAYLAGRPAAADALAVAREHEGYAAAWEFAALAARLERDLDGALEAARRASELRPDDRWQRFAEEVELERTRVALDAVSAKLAAGDAEGALNAARELLAVRPDLEPARVLAIRAALAAGRAQDAALLVPALPDDPGGLALKGRVAEALGQWELAADLYRRLPEDYPERCERLAIAEREIRAASAPPYVTRAMASPAVTRRGLAAILAWELPALVRNAGGPVPVFEDVVQLAERADIVGVARAGLVAGDRVTRRFHPDRPVSERELRGVLERVAERLGRSRPEWCDGTVRATCLELPGRLDGRAVAGLVGRVAGLEGEPCRRR